MSTPPGQASSGLRVRLPNCLKRLQSMSTDHERFPFAPEDVIFLDDLLLHMNLWTTDIRGDEKLEDFLDWIEEIQPTATTMQILIQELDKELQSLDVSFKTAISGEGIKGTTAEIGTSESRLIQIPKDSRKSLHEVVSKLTAYTAPLKAAANVALADRTVTHSKRINENLRSQLSPKIPKGEMWATYFLLDHPFPAREKDCLLGAIVEKPGDVHNLIPGDRSQMEYLSKKDIPVRVEIEENYSVLVAEVLSRTAQISLDFDVVGVGATVSYSRSRSSQLENRYPRVTTRSFVPPDLYIEWVMGHYLEKKTPKFLGNRPVYLVVGTKIASLNGVGDDLLFAVEYKMIKYWKRFIGDSIKFKCQPFNEGAVL